jgi:hypothetical protein
MSMPCKVGGISTVVFDGFSCLCQRRCDRCLHQIVSFRAPRTFDLAPSGHLPNLSRTAAQKAALITIPLTGWCMVIAAQPSPDG